MGNRCLSIALGKTAVSSGAVVFTAMCDRSRLAAEAVRDAAKTKAGKPAGKRGSECQSGSDPAPKRMDGPPRVHGEAICTKPSVDQEQ